MQLLFESLSWLLSIQLSSLLFFTLSIPLVAPLALNANIDNSYLEPLSKRVTNYINEEVTCSDIYGHPLNRDCEDVIKTLENILGTNPAASSAWISTIFEFVAIGQESRVLGSSTYYTPMFWTSRTCTGALFVDISAGQTSDVETWLGIWDAAANLNSICTGYHTDRAGSRGGRVTGLGKETGDLIFYLYGPDADFDKIVASKLVCPGCDQPHCSVAGAINRQCSNNPTIEINPSQPMDPQKPATLPKAKNDVLGTVGSLCGHTCKSQADCDCNNTKCVADSSIVTSLRQMLMTCHFTSSSPAGKIKRGELEPMVDMSRCVCNSSYVGEGCCDAVDGMVFIH